MMWSNDRPIAPGFYWCHQRGKTRIVHIWCYKNGTELFTNEDGGASIKDALYDGAQWMVAVNPPNPQDQNESAQPAPGVAEGWLRAIDEALVVTHLGVANAGDGYEDAKRKLNELICWHVAVATDPAVNGGFKLVPIEPTFEMLDKGSDQSDGYVSIAQEVWAAMIAVAPEVKP